jgi:hypothetical protein
MKVKPVNADSIFGIEYYDKLGNQWETFTFKCPKCDWVGLGKDAKQGDLIDGAFELCCPNFTGIGPNSIHGYSNTIAYIKFPTNKQTKLYGTTSAKKFAHEREKFVEEVEKLKLNNSGQLPDIAGDNIIITWDLDKIKNDNYTLIKHNDKILWKERAFYEGYSRYIEVGKLLTEKYGNRIKDFIPTEKSKLYLYGDKLSAPKTIANFRNSLLYK